MRLSGLEELRLGGRGGARAGAGGGRYDEMYQALRSRLEVPEYNEYLYGWRNTPLGGYCNID